MIKPILTRMMHNVSMTLCFIAITSMLSAQSVKADTVSDVTTIIANLTCETTELGNMIHGEFGHTCLPMSFSTLAMALILNPLAPLYLAGITTMNINNQKLFPNSCARTNRAIPYNAQSNPRGPVIPFAFCNDPLLYAAVAEAAVKATIEVTSAVVSGTNVWDAIKSAFTLDPKTYNLGPNFDSISIASAGYAVGYGSNGGAWAMAGVIPIPVNVVQDNDRICVSTVGVTGWLSMGCKYIAEPAPISRYSSFMQGGTPDAYTQCIGTGSCYTDANLNSKTFLTISGPLIGCIKAMINKFLMDPTVCTVDARGNSSTVSALTAAAPSTFFQFQLNMQRTLTALLTLYIILFGFKLVLGASEIKQSEIIMFFIKFILVVYFSVGINLQAGGQPGFDGMTQWAFPIMFEGANDVAGWIMNASPSGLCQFTSSAADTTSVASANITDSSGNILGATSTQLAISSTQVSSNNYAAGYGWLAMWDALDCRVAHYVGLDSMGDASSSAAQGTAATDGFNFSIPPYFFLLAPALLTGNVAVAMLAISYPVLIISVAAYVVNAFVVCMIAIVVLGILAPLFVPLALFEFTKGYFDSWVKLLLSFVLQPMVVATFMITLFTVYDAGFYGTCRFAKFDVPQVYAGGETIIKRLFVINSDPAAYQDDDWKTCQKSLGWMLNAPFAAASSAASSLGSVGGVVSLGQSFNDLSAKYPILSAITDDVGLFLTSPNLAFQAIESFLLSILTACFCLYLMYHMSSQISEFATDMVEGVSVGNMAIQHRAIMSKVQEGAQKMQDKLNEKKVKPKEEGEGKARKDGSGAGDSAGGGDKGTKSEAGGKGRAALDKAGV